MTLPKTSLGYESPANTDILEAYINKCVSYNNAGARKIRRQLRKLKRTRNYTSFSSK